MKKSLFSRYFYMCTSIVLVSTLVLGIILLLFTAQYLRSDNLELLTRNAYQAAQLTVDNYQRNYYKFLDVRGVSAGYSILSNATGADVFLVDHTGKTILCSEPFPCNHTTYRVESGIIKQALNGGYQGVGRLSGIYEQPHYIVGIPVALEDSVIGLMFVAAPDSGMSGMLIEVLRMFLIGAAIVLVITFVIVYFVTENMVRPLRQMADAAQSFAKGDFTAKIEVGGEDEIDKLAMAFNNMASSLSELEITRRSFVANVSHELKTPMTSIGGFIDGMLDGTIPEDQRNYYLKLVSTEVKRLSRLVVSMLGIARIEAGEMELQPQVVDVNEIMCRTIFTFERQIDEKKIQVSGLDADKTYVLADRDLLHQIAYNLVENAVKFTGENGNIDINYSTDGKMVHVAVRNSGEGLPKEEIPRLFDRFYKTDKSRSIDKNGVGLGLYIVKTLVHIQGGEIVVKSVEGEYVEFMFSMPCAQTKQPSSIFRKSDKSK